MDSETTTAITPAHSDAQILAARDVMLQLRPVIPPQTYLSAVRRMMKTDGYRLVALSEDGVVRAVAGYRLIEMLYCGRILYVDDLNTDLRHRSKGHGRRLLEWLESEGLANQCGELHLDSGVQREQTHRFYFREGLAINAYHFRVRLPRIGEVASTSNLPR